MQYFRDLGSGKIECLLCKHHCHISEAKAGVCGININDGGELKTEVYGYPSAINLDPIEKKPLYHFLPNSLSLSIGTVGCNFRCPFCQNWHISQTSQVDKGRFVSPEMIVDLAVQSGAKSISYTYNEPAIWYPYAKDIGVLAKDAGLKNIFVSSGFESNEVLEDIVSFIDAVNIDLKSFDKSYYKKILKSDLDGVLDGLRFFAKSPIHLEITTLLIDGVNNQDIEAISNFISDLDPDTPYHLSAFYPNYKMSDHKATAKSSLIEAKEVAKKAGLNYIYLGNVPYSNDTSCPSCGNDLVVRSGYSAKLIGIVDGKCTQCGKPIKGVWSE